MVKRGDLGRGGCGGGGGGGGQVVVVVVVVKATLLWRIRFSSRVALIGTVHGRPYNTLLLEAKSSLYKL